jgi:hypothetical protein
MVTNLNITLDDDIADSARSVKDDLGLTWAEFVEAAAECLRERDESAREAPESPPDPAPDTSPAHEREPEHSAHARESEGLRERIDALDEVPGSGRTEEARRDAIEAMAELLRERGTAEKSDLLAVVDADAVGYTSEASFWSNCIKGKNTLKALDSVQTPPEGGRVWRWVGKN